jgi:hypothetical protein
MVGTVPGDPPGRVVWWARLSENYTPADYLVTRVLGSTGGRSGSISDDFRRFVLEFLRGDRDVQCILLAHEVHLHCQTPMLSRTALTASRARVNPVHVLDLAFILPGMIVTAVSCQKRRPLGLLVAAPLLTFSAVMGIAILSMFTIERARGGAIQAAPVFVMSIVVLLSVYGSYSHLRHTSPRH